MLLMGKGDYNEKKSIIIIKYCNAFGNNSPGIDGSNMHTINKSTKSTSMPAGK